MYPSLPPMSANSPLPSTYEMFPQVAELAPKRRIDPERIKHLFRAADKAGEGVIMSTELMDILRSLGPPLSDLTDHEFEVLFFGSDANSNGLLKYDKFIDWVMQAGAMEDDPAISPVWEEHLMIRRLLMAFEADSSSSPHQMPLVTPARVEILAQILNIDLRVDVFLVPLLRMFLKDFMLIYQSGDFPIQDVGFCMEIIEAERARVMIYAAALHSTGHDPIEAFQKWYTFYDYCGVLWHYNFETHEEYWQPPEEPTATPQTPQKQPANGADRPRTVQGCLACCHKASVLICNECEGCFCYDCFTGMHSSGDGIPHIPYDALQLTCVIFDDRVATCRCIQCGLFYSDEGFLREHAFDSDSLLRYHTSAYLVGPSPVLRTTDMSNFLISPKMRPPLDMLLAAAAATENAATSPTGQPNGIAPDEPSGVRTPSPMEQLPTLAGSIEFPVEDEPECPSRAHIPPDIFAMQALREIDCEVPRETVFSVPRYVDSGSLET